MDRVDDVVARGLARTSPHGTVLSGIARGLSQLFPLVADTPAPVDGVSGPSGKAVAAQAEADEEGAPRS